MKAMLLLVFALVLVGCAKPSVHLEGFRSSLQKLDESYAEEQKGRGASLLNSQPVEGMEDASSTSGNSWRYLAFQSEMYRGMDKGDKPGWYRDAAKEEVSRFQHAPEDLRQFVLNRTEEATQKREQMR